MGKPKKVVEPPKEVLVPVEDGVQEVVAPAPVGKGKVGVELDHDIPYGPKKGVRYFDNKDDAEAYQKRFGGKLV